MTAGRIAHLEHIAEMDAQGQGQTLRRFQPDPPGQAVLEVADRGLVDANEPDLPALAGERIGLGGVLVGGFSRVCRETPFLWCFSELELASWGQPWGQWPT